MTDTEAKGPRGYSSTMTICPAEHLHVDAWHHPEHKHYMIQFTAFHGGSANPHDICLKIHGTPAELGNLVFTALDKLGEAIEKYEPHWAMIYKKTLASTMLKRAEARAALTASEESPILR